MLFLLFILGAILASFTQCYAHRYPYKPLYRSQCNHCKQHLQWLHLFPILSFICQKGKCPYCFKKIPLYYPVFEGIGGIYLCYIFTYQLPKQHINWIIIGIFLFIMAQIDCEYYMVPNTWQALFALISLIYQLPTFYTLLIISLLWLIYLILDSIFPQAIGGADIKVLLIIYYLLGTYHTLFILLFSCLFALIFIWIFKLKHTYIPFIPFIFSGYFIHHFIWFSTEVFYLSP